MAIDSLRRNSIVESLKRSDLVALASLSPSEVLLLTGYWPVMGQSLAVFSREGERYCIVPEDELELAKKTSDAEFIPYKPATLEKLTTPAAALIQPTRELFLRLKMSSGDVGTDLDAGMTAMAYQSVSRFPSHGGISAAQRGRGSTRRLGRWSPGAAQVCQNAD